MSTVKVATEYLDKQVFKEWGSGNIVSDYPVDGFMGTRTIAKLMEGRTYNFVTKVVNDNTDYKAVFVCKGNKVSRSFVATGEDQTFTITLGVDEDTLYINNSEGVKVVVSYEQEADYDPKPTEFKTPQPFRFWCQTVLPLVYDDSLSYYELLSKVVNYLNSLINDVTNVENIYTNLTNAYTELEAYVNTYFDNLDVSEAINEKLDYMAEHGDFDALMEEALARVNYTGIINARVDEDLPDIADPKIEAEVAERLTGVVSSQIGGAVSTQIDGVVEEQLGGVVDEKLDDVVSDQIGDVVSDQIGDVVGEQIERPVSNWLAGNFETPPVDKSLSIDNASADAKVTGDIITHIKDISIEGYTRKQENVPETRITDSYISKDAFSGAAWRIHSNVGFNCAYITNLIGGAKYIIDMYGANPTIVENGAGWLCRNLVRDGAIITATQIDTLEHFTGYSSIGGRIAITLPYNCDSLIINSTNATLINVYLSSMEFESHILPEIDPTDDGKFLGVVNGEPAWNNVPNDLPNISVSDNGKVLGVSDGDWRVVNIPNGNLPAVAGSDDGKILMVEGGDWENESVFEFKNLYNKNTNTDGVYISDTGELVEYATRSTTDYIYLPAGSYWLNRSVSSSEGFSYIAYYNLSKEFTSRVQLSSNVITVESACYARLWGVTERITNSMVVKGTTQPTGYIPYVPTIKEDNIYKIDGNKIRDNTVNFMKTDFVKHNNNLINRMTITKGYAITAQGVLIESAQYAITEKIYPKHSTTYAYNTCWRISYFDKGGNHIKSDQLSTSQALTGTYTTIATFDYAIVTLPLSVVYGDNWMLSEGDSVPQYEPQYLIIDGYRIYDEPDSGLTPIDLMKRWDKIVTDKSSTYLRSTEADALISTDKNTDAVYAKYDALMALNSDYITKTELGSDGNNTTLYRYDFKTPEYTSGNPGTTPSANRKTKIILISGVHPEWAGIYGLYNALERITNDPALADVKAQMHFIVMPIVNAYGCNNNSRKNANGIDLARNFAVDFVPGDDPSSSTYSGTTPLSEVEDQYVDEIMSENPDAIWFASCHSFQSATGHANWNMWGCAATLYYTNISAKIIDKLTLAWDNKYGYTDDSFGQTELAAPNGSEGKQAMKYGIQGGTWEVCDYFNAEEDGVQYSASAISRASEVYVNMIKVAMSCFDKFDKKLDM